MAELNFNALARPGPRGFMQGYEQGQEQRMAQETNQIAQDTSRFKLEELKRDREEAMQLQTQLKGLGYNGDLNAFFDEIAKTGKPQYVQMALEGKQKLKDLDAYAKLGGGGAMPTGAPAPAVSSNRVNEPNAAPGVEVFKVPEQLAPVNALAAPTPAAMPVNALAPQSNADQIAPTQQRIRQLLDFARANPRMASQAMSEARILQDQLELFSKRGQNEPPDAVMMQRLGYPPTQEGFKAYQDAKRQDRLLTPEELKQKLLLAAAGRAPGTTVVLPTQEKAFETKLGTEQADDLIKSRAAARDAVAIIDTVKTGRDIMKSGMITGAGADFLVSLNQGLKTVGIDAGYADASANSQAFAANMANNVGKLIKQFGAGTGLSNADREYAEKMAGSKITLDSKAINRILDINEKASRNVITRHNKDVKGIKTNVPLEVELPPEIKTPVASAPSSAIAYLRANPSMKGAFDAKYGAGAADRALKGQ